LGIDDPRLVNSPTFVLIQEYDARSPIYHFDAYRLHCAAEFADLGAGEYFQGSGVCLVEWADKVKDCLPAEYLWIDIKVTGPTSRRFVVTGHGEKYRLIEKSLQAIPRTLNDESVLIIGGGLAGLAAAIALAPRG